MKMFIQLQSWFDNHYSDGGWKKVFGEGVRFLRAFSVFMLIGAVLANVWANLDPEGYEKFKHVELFTTSWLGEYHEGVYVVTIAFFVTDILMSPFFLVASKEAWEAIITKNGRLRGKKAIVPLSSTVGGIVAPALLYVGVSMMFGQFEAITGWAIPTATDIAFSYVIGRIVFGPNHPAITFLLLLAIADDAGGLGILAIFYPSKPLELEWLLLSAASVAFGYYVLQRYMKVHNFWPYFIIVGGISFFAFVKAGLHPVLGLIPAVFTMPHADSDLGFYIEDESEHKNDTLNMMEHWWKTPIELILCLFAFVNAGVQITNIGVMTIPIVIALVVGKPVGIFLFGKLASKIVGYPEGIDDRILWVLGCVAGIGFTVSLFVSTVALPAGQMQDAAKVGALLSLPLAAVVAIFFARKFRIAYSGKEEMPQQHEPELAMQLE